MLVAFTTVGFAPTQPVRLHAPVRHVAMSAVDTVTGWQSATLSKLVDGVDLKQKDYAADMGFDSFNINGMSGSILSFEAPGKSNVAWCSALTMSDGAANARCSITAWCGPLSDVPHLVASAGVSNGGIDLFIDFRPRAECAYNPTGEYEEPDTREKFAMSGNRKDFAAAFFTDEMVAWRDALCAMGIHTPLSAEAMAEQCASPLYLDLRLPLTDDAAAAAAKACEEACMTWLGWMQTSTENKRDLPAGAKQTQVYARDTKVKANLYGVLLSKYTEMYGEEGKGLAAADAGPLDEAYVGGAS